MASQKTRTMRLTKTDAGLAVVMHQQTGKGAIQVDAYFLSLSDGSVVFGKTDGTRYTVKAGTCTCPGHKYYPKTICKHRAAVAKLSELKLLS